MSNFLDKISWFMNLWEPDHRAEDAVFDLMVEDIQQKLKEQEEPPQKILTADDFFTKVKESKSQQEKKEQEHYNQCRWDKKTLDKKVQNALQESAKQGFNYIMIKCGNWTVASANINSIKNYLSFLGFNTEALEIGFVGHRWYVKGFLRKCRN